MHQHLLGMQFGGLPFAHRFSQVALDRNTATGCQSLDVRLVVAKGFFGDYLQVRHARTVIDLQEAESRLRIAPGSHPTADPYPLSDFLGLTRPPNTYVFHGYELIPQGTS